MSGEQVMVTIADIRALKYCARGARKFFERNGLDWSEFLEHGLPAETIEATKDSMAIAVAEVARGRRR